MAPLANPLLDPIENIEFWVQLHNVPMRFRSKRVCVDFGNRMGMFLEFDPINFTEGWKPFVRIRVSLKVTRPLMEGMHLKKKGQQAVWINFKYERVPTFCFVCGIIGHGESMCPVAYKNPEYQVKLGVWMRASLGRQQDQNIGARWLVEDSPEPNPESGEQVEHGDGGTCMTGFSKNLEVANVGPKRAGVSEPAKTDLSTWMTWK